MPGRLILKSNCAARFLGVPLSDKDKKDDIRILANRILADRVSQSLAAEKGLLAQLKLACFSYATMVVSSGWQSAMVRALDG